MTDTPHVKCIIATLYTIHCFAAAEVGSRTPESCPVERALARGTLTARTSARDTPSTSLDRATSKRTYMGRPLVGVIENNSREEGLRELTESHRASGRREPARRDHRRHPRSGRTAISPREIGGRGRGRTASAAVRLRTRPCPRQIAYKTANLCQSLGSLTSRPPQTPKIGSDSHLTRGDARQGAGEDCERCSLAENTSLSARERVERRTAIRQRGQTCSATLGFSRGLR